MDPANNFFNKLGTESTGSAASEIFPWYFVDYFFCHYRLFKYHELLSETIIVEDQFAPDSRYFKILERLQLEGPKKIESLEKLIERSEKFNLFIYSLDQPVWSSQYQMSGKIDVLCINNGRPFPVSLINVRQDNPEEKAPEEKKPPANIQVWERHQAQSTCYCLMLEEMTGKTPSFGSILYLTSEVKKELLKSKKDILPSILSLGSKVPYDQKMRKWILDKKGEIIDIINGRIKPNRHHMAMDRCKICPLNKYECDQSLYLIERPVKEGTLR